MPEPIALCLEDLVVAGATRYTRCVAISGARTGLGVRVDGHIVWENKTNLAFELWVSADERLILLRPEGAVALRVHREGRDVDPPSGKPVVLLDQDEVSFAGHRLRIHVHGQTSKVHAPQPLAQKKASRGGRNIATALAVGAAAIGCDKIAVLLSPPKPASSATASMVVDAGIDDAAGDAFFDGAAEQGPADSGQDVGGEEVSAPESGLPEAGKKDGGRKQPIEVRHHPPAPVPLDEDKR